MKRYHWWVLRFSRAWNIYVWINLPCYIQSVQNWCESRDNALWHHSDSWFDVIDVSLLYEIYCDISSSEGRIYAPMKLPIHLVENVMNLQDRIEYGEYAYTVTYNWFSLPVKVKFFLLTWGSPSRHQWPTKEVLLFMTLYIAIPTNACTSANAPDIFNMDMCTWACVV